MLLPACILLPLLGWLATTPAPYPGVTGILAALLLGESWRNGRRVMAWSGTLSWLDNGEFVWQTQRMVLRGRPLLFRWGIYLPVYDARRRRRGVWLMHDAMTETAWRRWCRALTMPPPAGLQ